MENRYAVNLPGLRCHVQSIRQLQPFQQFAGLHRPFACPLRARDLDSAIAAGNHEIAQHLTWCAPALGKT